MNTESRDHAPSITAVTSGQSHTPGPWRTYARDGGVAAYIEGCGPGRPQIAFAACVKHKDPLTWFETQAANARLIAAAPELLEAHQPELLDGIADEIGATHLRQALILRVLAEHARAAIRAAGGK